MFARSTRLTTEIEDWAAGFGVNSETRIEFTTIFLLIRKLSYAFIKDFILSVQ